MADQRNMERDEPRPSSGDQERVRGIADQEQDDEFDDSDDLEDDEEEEDEDRSTL